MAFSAVVPAAPAVAAPVAPRYPAHSGYAADLPPPNAAYSRAPTPQPYGRPAPQTYAPPPAHRPSAGQPMMLNSNGIY